MIYYKETGSGISLEPDFISGGDGGESNSPSKRSCSEYTTSLVSSFVLPDQPLLTEFSQASR